MHSLPKIIDTWHAYKHSSLQTLHPTVDRARTHDYCRVDNSGININIDSRPLQLH